MCTRPSVVIISDSTILALLTCTENSTLETNYLNVHCLSYADRKLVAFSTVDDLDDTVFRLYFVLQAVFEQRRRQYTVGPVVVQNLLQVRRIVEYPLQFGSAPFLKRVIRWQK